MLPALVLVYIVFSRRANAVPTARRWFLLQTSTVLFVVVAALSIWGNRLSNELMQIPWGLKFALTNTPIVQPDVEAEYVAMQRAIPNDAPTLASVDNAFLLDFRAHSISIADYPGAASLPPGWPSREDGEALARYLLANHLRYLVYDYGYFAASDREAPHVIADPSRTQWIHSEARIALRSHQQFAELARTRPHLYDDGNIYILDLAAPQTTPNSSPAAVKAPNNP
jgi:hypothetical protein